MRDDPIAPLVGGGNQGGFRYLGVAPFEIRHCALYSDLADLDWPDRLDPETGRFTYYGDNKTPGGSLHNTTRHGNAILRQLFDAVHLGQRESVPPIFIFTKGTKGRDVIFRGLAVRNQEMGQTEDLVAIWKTNGDQRFQNYKAVFTVLDVPRLDRAWIEDLKAARDPTTRAPEAGSTGAGQGVAQRSPAPRSREYRTPAEQVPTHEADLGLLRQVVSHYNAHPDGAYAFERCAGELFRLLDPNVRSIDLTRPWRDGGRDALGLYQIGDAPSSIKIESLWKPNARTRRPRIALGSGKQPASSRALGTVSSVCSLRPHALVVKPMRN